MPLRLLLILAAAAALAIYGHPIPALVGTTALVLPAAVLVLARPDRTRSVGTPLEEARAERAVELTAYASCILIGAVGLFVSLWWPAVAIAVLAAAAIWAVVWWPDAARTSNLTTSILIKRERADVFAFVGDARNLPMYWPYYEAIERLTPGPVGLGTQCRSRVRFPKGFHNFKEDHVFEAVEEIVGFDPPSRLATHLSDRPRPNLAVFTFDDTPEGTLLTHSFTFVSSYSSAVLGGGFSRRAANAELRASRAIGWGRAKEILETGTA